MGDRIWLSSPTMHGEEQEFVKEAFDTNWVAPLGANVTGFEQEMADYLGIKAATACVSGTSALFMAYKLAGVKEGDKVFCSDMTFSATANPISYLGAEQVFIDSERDTWNMDPVALEQAFKKYPECRCVALVHLYGTPAKTDEIKAVCDKYGATLVEDAAESLSATYKGRQTGTFGKYNIISFNGNKIITTSGGGMLLSDDTAAIQKAIFWSTQARDPAPWYEHSEMGYNFRMSNIVAGIGRGQLLHLEEHRAAKKKIYERYKKALAELPLTMNPYLEYTEPNFWLSCMTIDKGIDVKPMDVIEKLSEINAEARPIWKPMHLQPVYSDRDFITAADTSTPNKPAATKPVTEDIFECGLCLPSDIKMTDEEQDMVIDVVRSCFR